MTVKVRIPHSVDVNEYLTKLPAPVNPEDFVIYFGHHFVTEEKTYLVHVQGVALSAVNDFLKSNPGEVVE